MSIVYANKNNNYDIFFLLNYKDTFRNPEQNRQPAVIAPSIKANDKIL